MEEKIKKTRTKKTEEKPKIEEIVKPSSKQSFEGQTKKSQSASSKGLIVVIRIAGEVKKKKEIVNTLYRLRLRKKYSCVLINSLNKGLMGMLWKARHYVAYGDIDKETLIKLLETRAKSIEGDDKKIKIKADETAKELMNGKSLTELGFKPFFRLHPPRKGIKSKLQYPKGVLGNHKNDINKLVERML